MNTTKVYDIIGIGIGPFNLGLAALADRITGLECLFIDKATSFDWHPGMMLPGARLQVPFYADLVTLADPTSKFSFMNYLKVKGRLFRFAIYENNFITRSEYNDYCKWVVSNLNCLHFGLNCEAVYFNDIHNIYEVILKDNRTGSVDVVKAKHIVLGIGTIPSLPDCFKEIHHPYILHSADYLNKKDLLLKNKSISVVGSGQSAAEIFYDLLCLNQPDLKLNWFTRSERFFPMEYSKLSLEMTSPDYIEHFYGLKPEQKTYTLSRQSMLYKGINFSLINSIYDELYQQSLEPDFSKPGMFTNCELKSISQIENNQLKQGFENKEMQSCFEQISDVVILATGYEYHLPFVIESAEGIIKTGTAGGFALNRNYSINEAQNIFVQNADLHSHGFTAPDLGMGPYRNATILNAILGHGHFELETKIAFQTFGLPK